MRKAAIGLAAFRQVTLLNEVVLEQLDQPRVGVIQRRVEDRLRDVEQPERHVGVALDGFPLAVVDVASVATLSDVDDAEDVSRTRVTERHEVRNPVVGTSLSPVRVLLVVDVVVGGARLPEDRFLLSLVVSRRLHREQIF